MITHTHWKAYNFSTNQYDTKVFSRFTREFKGYLRYICDTLKADIVSFEANNFKVSALVQRQDAQLVRIALDDVRRSRNFDFILLRTLPGWEMEYPSRTTFARVENLSNSISNL